MEPLPIDAEKRRAVCSSEKHPTAPSAPDDKTQAQSVENHDVSSVRLLVIGEATGVAYRPIILDSDVFVGRSKGCTIHLDDPQLSRRHLRLRVGDGSEVEDLGSVNGTQVDGESLTAHRPIPLRPGQTIRAGGHMLVVQAVTRRGATEAPVSSRSFTDKSEPLVKRVAAGRIGVLLTGDTGVGKEVLARRIHQLSARAEMPMVAINCASLGESLLESELFGYERGAFTGAVTSKPGLLETADGGTVFLDEIGEMPLPTQAKLLRVLEERAILRLGSLKPRQLDVRFVAATNRDLSAEIAGGRFRRDLYFRLNGVSIHIPPLRERVDEILPLGQQFLELACQASGRAVPPITKAAERALLARAWPGNIRELRNVMERAALLCDDVLDVTHLPESEDEEVVPSRGTTRSSRGHHAPGEQEEAREKIVEALQACAWNQTKAAKMLGVSRRTLVDRLRTLDIPRPRKD